MAGNYQILHSDVFALSILWTVYYYNGTSKRAEHGGCCCDFGGFWGFYGETKELFLYCLLNVLEVCDNERGVLRNECESEMFMEQTRKGRNDNKEQWWHHITSSFLTRYLNNPVVFIGWMTVKTGLGGLWKFFCTCKLI